MQKTEFEKLMEKYRQDMISKYGVKTDPPKKEEKTEPMPKVSSTTTESPSPIPEKTEIKRTEQSAEPRTAPQPQRDELMRDRYSESGRASRDLPFTEETDFRLYTAQGYLRLKVTDTESIPVGSVIISVSKQQNGAPVFYRELMTDNTGNTPIITLAVPPKAAAEGADVSACYDIVASLSGYETVIKKNVPVFANTVSVQPIEMSKKRI